MNSAAEKYVEYLQVVDDAAPQLPPMQPVFEQIESILRDAGVPFKHLHHEPTPTSEDSARVRGEPLAIGGKALSMRADGRSVLLVLSAARRFNSKRFRKHLRVKSLRFLSAEELFERTGLVPGSVPPFGAPVLPFELFLDESLFENDRIAFNAGSLRDSIILGLLDYVSVVGEYTRVAVASHPSDDSRVPGADESQR